MNKHSINPQLRRFLADAMALSWACTLYTYEAID